MEEDRAREARVEAPGLVDRLVGAFLWVAFPGEGLVEAFHAGRARRHLRSQEAGLAGDPLEEEGPEEAGHEEDFLAQAVHHAEGDHVEAERRVGVGHVGVGREEEGLEEEGRDQLQAEGHAAVHDPLQAEIHGVVIQHRLLAVVLLRGKSKTEVRNRHSG